MRRKLTKILSGLLQRLKKDRPYVIVNFLGKELRVLKGTLRLQVDKDDAWFAYLAKHARVLFDIGANVGYTALLANLYGSPKAIVLVDANLEALSTAVKNLAANNMSLNCRFHQSFVSSNDTERVKFFTVGTGAAGSMYRSHAKTAAAIDSYVYVETVSLNTLCDRTDLWPDLVKIDVEGAESLVLEGAEKLAELASAFFFVEMHSTMELPMIENAKRVLDWCERMNYKAYYLKEHELLERPEVIAHRGKCHLLLLPIQASYPSGLKSIQEGQDLPPIETR